MTSLAQDTPQENAGDLQDAANRQTAQVAILDSHPTGEPASVVAASSELPDSPGTSWARAQSASQTDNAPQQATPAPQPANTQEQKPQRPVGTAAAEAPKVSGITAAEPAGVAIAPAKQRRVRTIVIKVGAILAAGAAVGAVVALSEATSSKPPGAR
jgi:hypothetical protein